MNRYEFCCIYDELIKRRITTLPIITTESEYCSLKTLNKPCLIKYIFEDQNNIVSNGKPDFASLVSKFKNVEVDLVDNKNSDVLKRKFDEFILYWEDKIANKTSILYYLKDFHFNKYNNFLYDVPNYLKDDWLNDFYENKLESDDFKFLYMGPGGTCTQLHSDVLCSHSWSINLCGAKRWLIFKKGDETNLTDEFKNLPSNIFVDTKCNLEKLMKIQGFYDIVQETNEIIFVPSGWFHQVINIDDTISLNHNFMDESNIKFVLEFILNSLKQVEEEIGHLKRGMNHEEWNTQCQNILKCWIGMDIQGFCEFLKYTLTKHPEHSIQLFEVINTALKYIS